MAQLPLWHPRSISLVPQLERLWLEEPDGKDTTTHCVTLGKWLNLSEPQCHLPETRVSGILTSQVMQSLEEIYKKGLATSAPRRHSAKQPKKAAAFTEKLFHLTGGGKTPTKVRWQGKPWQFPQSCMESRHLHLPVVWQCKQGSD